MYIRIKFRTLRKLESPLTMCMNAKYYIHVVLNIEEN